MLRLAAWVSSLGALACAGGATVEVGAQRDLQGLRTWEWLQPAPPGAQSKSDPVLHARVQQAIARELHTRGFHPASAERADLRVAYRIALTPVVVVRTETPAQQYLPSFHAGSPSYDIGTSERRLVRYERVALSVELRDARTNEVVWRGRIETRVRGRFVVRADDAVAALLEELPPRREGT